MMKLINKKICMGKDIGIHGNVFGGFMMSLGAMTWDLFKIRLKNSK